MTNSLNSYFPYSFCLEVKLLYLQPTFVILSDVVSFELILNVTQEKLAVFIQSVTVRIVFLVK